MIRGFAARLAWREGRAAYRRLSVFVSSIALGVGSLVAIHSFRADVQRSLGEQARALLGADVRVSSRRAFPEEFDAVLDSMARLERDVARTTTLASMVLDIRSQGVRLFQVQGVDSGYPYYGEVTSIPNAAWAEIHDGPWAVADPAVFIQLDAAIGDTLLIGEARFVLRGEVVGLPTELGFQSAIGPRLYISRGRLPSTGLLTFGSIVRYHANFRMPEREDRDEFYDRHSELLRANQLQYTTAGVRAQELSSAVEDVSRYLGLMGLAALFLGGIGVASAINVYIREKVVTVAVLRCLGALQRTLFTAYVLQAAGLALIGSVLGVGLGMLVQLGLPLVLTGLLPVGVTTQVSWVALGAGIALGVWVAVMFALGPLLEVRGVSPLIALRHDFEPPKRTDALRVGAFVLLALTLVGLTVLEAPSPDQGIGFRDRARRCGALVMGDGACADPRHEAIFSARDVLPGPPGGEQPLPSTESDRIGDVGSGLRGVRRRNGGARRGEPHSGVYPRGGCRQVEPFCSSTSSRTNVKLWKASSAPFRPGPSR